MEYFLIYIKINKIVLKKEIFIFEVSMNTKTKVKID